MEYVRSGNKCTRGTFEKKKNKNVRNRGGIRLFLDCSSCFAHKYIQTYLTARQEKNTIRLSFLL